MKRYAIALLVLVTLAIQSFAASVAVTNTTLQTKYGILTNVYFETASGPGSSTPSTNTAQTPSGGPGSYPIPAGTSGYLWSPQFTSAATISAGNWVLDFWASASSYSYFPITLINNQSSPTPVPLQVGISWNPSSNTFSGYEAANLGNIRFCMDTACNTMLNAWLESCSSSCTTSATSAYAWVKINTQIGAQSGRKGGTLVIYMVFFPQTTNFDCNFWGEAPSLSGTYAQCDNGAKVFSIYFDGNTPTSSFTESTGNTLSQTTGVGYGSSTISVLSLVTKAKYSAMSFATGIPAGGYIAETNVEAYALGSETLAYAGLVDSATASSLSNGLGGGQNGANYPFASIYWSSGADTEASTKTDVTASTWYYVDVIYSGTSATSFTTDLYSTLYSTPLATKTTNENPLSSVTKFYFGLPTGNGGATGTTLYYNWGRVRAYPPGGVMPTVNFGSVSTITNGLNSPTVSIEVTTSTGTLVTAVASNIQSQNLATAEAQYAMTFNEAQVTVPANDYLSVVITASADPCTVYWGVGQPTDFQVPVRVLT